MHDLEAFRRELHPRDSEIDLMRAALVMGRFAYPALDVADVQARLEEIAQQAAGVLANSQDPVQLAAHLFGRDGFRGNTANYDDPRNSFVNEVLERRLGIPITLSLVFIDVARRLGLRAEGVGMPGHFIVLAGHDLFVDPYNGGAPLTRSGCRKLMQDMGVSDLGGDAMLLKPVGARYTLARMLNNLKRTYLRAEQFDLAMHVVQRGLLISPDNESDLRTQAQLYLNKGQRRQAVETYERLFLVHPKVREDARLRELVPLLAEQAGRWN